MRHLSKRLVILFMGVAIVLITAYCGRDSSMEKNVQSGQQNTLENYSQLNSNSVPFIGAQVFIEPGQTEEEISEWFMLMAENHLTACRIRMFESYIRDDHDNWDFTLFDHAFRAAEQSGIMIWATLYPVTGDNINIGGDKFPQSKEKLGSIKNYIGKTVNHFKNYKSLAGWVLLNEPGVRGELPDNEFAASKFSEWEKGQSFPEHSGGGYPVLMDFRKEKFLLDYTTWFLKWISDEINKHDQSHDLHVNNHDIFVNCSEYNFPEWCDFLTSLGGSAHASWHFNYFTRDKYAVAMSADCEMILSGSAGLPWFMTEVQGGNNTYSGFNPMCPTREEIAQWLWITIGTEGKGAIFWTLNPRASGIEAGEWGMVDFQDQTTDRLQEAGRVAEILQDNAELFSNARKAQSHISILYCRESMWAEKKMTIWESGYEARHSGAVMKSVLAWFEAISEMGISPNLKAMNEFDFSKGNYKGETIILSHQLSLPSFYVDSLEHFVAAGGKLIVDGLTAYFDENMHSTMITGFDYENLFGGNVNEFIFQQDIFNINVNGNNLFAHMWKGYVTTTTGEPIVDKENKKIGIRNQFGEGEVVWLPALIGLGSRIVDDYSPLQEFLASEARESIEKQTVRFKRPHKKMLMKTLETGDKIITVIVNKNEQSGKIDLIFNRKIFESEIINSDSSEQIKTKFVELQPEETKVIIWN
jgi:beta-galactosidase